MAFMGFLSMFLFERIDLPILSILSPHLDYMTNPPFLERALSFF
jgi:hypothetical protein